MTGRTYSSPHWNKPGCRPRVYRALHSFWENGRMYDSEPCKHDGIDSKYGVHCVARGYLCVAGWIHELRNRCEPTDPTDALRRDGGAGPWKPHNIYTYIRMFVRDLAFRAAARELDWKNAPLPVLCALSPSLGFCDAHVPRFELEHTGRRITNGKAEKLLGSSSRRSEEMELHRVLYPNAHGNGVT